MDCDHSGTVFTIDCNYLFPEFAAAYLIVEGDRAAFVDNNTNRAAPLLLAALEEQGLKPGNVQYLIVTHAHLDHAGGTSAMAEACPGATLIAHPRAARHIIEPSRLIKGVKAVYGEQKYLELYGEIKPVDAGRVKAVEHDETLAWGGRELRFIHTLGHASHHMVIVDSGSNAVFTGDAFGLAYPLFQKGGRPFIFPSTSPPEFDPGEAKTSIRKIAETGAATAFPTHFGAFARVEEGASMMLGNIDRMDEILQQAVESGFEGADLESFSSDRMTRFFTAELEKRGLHLSGAAAQLLETDIRLNAMGISAAAQRMKKRSAAAGQ
ncbi:MAG: MBL fold metallo-hydrolase [Pseudomonadota bacterium]